jgi:hypothetical protein
VLGEKNSKATQAFTVNGIVGLQSVWIEEEADSNIYVVSDCIGWFPKHEKGHKFADEVCLKKNKACDRRKIMLVQDKFDSYENTVITKA